MASETRTIRVDMLARVEGEGGLFIRVKDGLPEEVRFKIFEPPRFFEALLRGRSRMEVADITARICGICPVAYQMSACQAVEAAAGVRVTGPLRELRRLLYAGEWIESHALHVFMLHAPDFLGFDDALAMAKDHPELVRRGLAVKKAGNAIVERIGGRAIHPVNVRVGGFFRVPLRSELETLLPAIDEALAALNAALPSFAALSFPDFERDYEFVALSHPEQYAVLEGRITSTKGLDVAVEHYAEHFEEIQVPHSTALQARIRARGAYHCGPLARFNVNHAKLSPEAKATAVALGFEAPCKNPYKSILARLVELVHAFSEAKRIIAAYTPPRDPFVDIPDASGTGHGATEAPRGLLYHRYRIASDGAIDDATIVPPTSQNQRTIEEDLTAIAPDLVSIPHAEATLRAERAVRNYDPCISCSTHFLDLRIERV